MPTGPKHLARHVTAARVRLYPTRRAFALAAGIGKRTVDKLETGERSAYRPLTKDKVERGLRWAPGSFDDVLDGGVPSPVPDEWLQRILHVWPFLSDETRAHLARVAEASRRELH